MFIISHVSPAFSGSSTMSTSFKPLVRRCFRGRDRLKLCRTYRFGSTTNLFPRRKRLKVAECLGQLKGFIYDALPFFVVPNLRVARQWKILAQWVSLETIVSKYASKVGVAREEYAEHIPCLSFIPVSTLEDGNATWNRVCFTSIRLHPNPARVFDT